MFRKILVINLMYIGDLLFTTPLLHVLRRQFPEAHIDILADEKNAWVIKYNPNISQLIGIDKKGYHNKLPNYLKLINQVRRENYDLVINLHPNERASAIAAFSGADKIVGFSAPVFRMMFTKLTKERTDIHQADAYLEVLRDIGVTNFSNNGLEITTDENSQQRADVAWPKTFNQVKVIGLNTGGSWPTKRWKKERFAQLADMLLKTGNGVAFFGGPMDKVDVDEILNLMENKDHNLLKVFTGKTTLLEMASLVEKCNALVSGDSGPMHIAVAKKVPVISIFGPSNPVRYHPYGQGNGVIVSSDDDCLGCGKHYCEHHSCMLNVSSEQVYNNLIEHL